MISDLEAEVAALDDFDLHALRDKWRERFGAPPKFRSTEMLRLLLAWRIQAVALGGLDRDTRETLARTGRVVAEGQDLGIGATLRRTWNGEEQVVTVIDNGFEWNGRTFKSLSAAATAIAGTRWNGPRFFGLRP
ncbi:MAG TPA: DUF2924 domain-containing protein [Sphingomicrobium sp.]|nr:DUF2924 domain-containing protein [Sphingomicrobium sp.]